VLPIPDFFDPRRVGELWRVPYEQRADEAVAWAREHELAPAVDDRFRMALLLVDVQNTFCLPGFELFVGGRSGNGAVEDSRRICEFLYRNLDVVTEVVPTLDTHQATQIFHALWLEDEDGNHPPPYTLVSVDDVERGVWRFNPEAGRSVGISADEGRRHLLHYVRRLEEGGKYALTIWPYHALLGGVGHALVPAIEEAVFFHTIARQSQPDFRVKGSNPLTEHYSAIGPEVTEGPDGETIGRRDDALVEKLLAYDAVVIAGQAKSHCVAWTIADLLEGTEADRRLAGKVYLLEDCTSAVCVPGLVDFTDDANRAVERFAAAGMGVVRSTDPLESWPGVAASARSRDAYSTSASRSLGR
jgi:nicotinamidase-related amidase